MSKYKIIAKPESSGRKRGTHKNPQWGTINSCFGKSGCNDRFQAMAAFGCDDFGGVTISYMQALEMLCGTTNALEEQ